MVAAPRSRSQKYGIAWRPPRKARAQQQVMTVCQSTRHARQIRYLIHHLQHPPAWFTPTKQPSAAKQYSRPFHADFICNVTLCARGNCCTTAFGHWHHLHRCILPNATCPATADKYCPSAQIARSKRHFDHKLLKWPPSG